eukprot:gene13861-9910_t
MYRNSNKLKDLESDEDESDTELLVPGGKPAAQSKNSNAVKLFDLQEIFSSCLISSTALENRMRHNARYDEDYADIQTFKRNLKRFPTLTPLDAIVSSGRNKLLSYGLVAWTDLLQFASPLMRSQDRDFAKSGKAKAILSAPSFRDEPSQSKGNGSESKGETETLPRTGSARWLNDLDGDSDDSDAATRQARPSSSSSSSQAPLQPAQTASQPRATGSQSSAAATSQRASSSSSDKSLPRRDSGASVALKFARRNFNDDDDDEDEADGYNGGGGGETFADEKKDAATAAAVGDSVDRDYHRSQLAAAPRTTASTTGGSGRRSSSFYGGEDNGGGDEGLDDSFDVAASTASLPPASNVRWKRRSDGAAAGDAAAGDAAAGGASLTPRVAAHGASQSTNALSDLGSASFDSVSLHSPADRPAATAATTGGGVASKVLGLFGRKATAQPPSAARSSTDASPTAAAAAAATTTTATTLRDSVDTDGGGSDAGDGHAPRGRAKGLFSMVKGALTLGGSRARSESPHTSHAAPAATAATAATASQAAAPSSLGGSLPRASSFSSLLPRRPSSGGLHNGAATATATASTVGGSAGDEDSRSETDTNRSSLD